MGKGLVIRSGYAILKYNWIESRSLWFLHNMSFKVAMLCESLLTNVTFTIFLVLSEILDPTLVPVFWALEKILQVSWHFLYPFFSHLRRFYESAEAFAPQLALITQPRMFLYPKINNFWRFYEGSTRFYAVLGDFGLFEYYLTIYD